MIRAELLNEVQALDRDDKLAIIRLLQEDVSDENTETFDDADNARRVYRVPSLWLKDGSANAIQMMMDLESETNG